MPKVQKLHKVLSWEHTAQGTGLDNDNSTLIQPKQKGIWLVETCLIEHYYEIKILWYREINAT